jgi:hypothetical protein
VCAMVSIWTGGTISPTSIQQPCVKSFWDGWGVGDILIIRNGLLEGPGNVETPF